MGREDQVEDVLRKFEIGNSDKIVRAILLKAKGMNERALEKVESFLKSGDRFGFIFKFRNLQVVASLHWCVLSSSCYFSGKQTMLHILRNELAFCVKCISVNHRDRTYLERECLVGQAWAVSEKIPARLYITIGLVAAY